MVQQPDIYDLLSKQLVSELTQAMLDSSTKSGAIDRESVPFWGGPITLARVLEATRTYAHGLPIPESSLSVSTALPSGEALTIRPTGTQVWGVKGISAETGANTGSCVLYWFDGNIRTPISTTSTSTTAASLMTAATPSPLVITNSGYLIVLNATEDVTLNYHYDTLGL